LTANLDPQVRAEDPEKYMLVRHEPLMRGVSDPAPHAWESISAHFQIFLTQRSSAAFFFLACEYEAAALKPIAKQERTVDHTQPTFDPVRTLTDRLEKLGISKNFFGELCGYSSSEISNFLNGKRTLGGERTLQFDAMLRSLEDLTDLFQPVGIRFSNREQVLRLIKSCEIKPEAAMSVRASLSELTAFDALAGRTQISE
jgi:hypothetical protein